MIVKSKDAARYECCVMPRKCVGDVCMAWREHFELHVAPLPKWGSRVPPMPTRPVATGKGYCGFVASG